MAFSDTTAAKNASRPVGRPVVAGLLGLMWAAGVLVAYIGFNHGYFVEKIATFGHFLLGGG